jgi:hypothetical protein
VFRDRAQVALNDLLVALQEAADLYRDDAEVAEGDAAARFARLADERRRQAERLIVLVRAGGDLPRQPDADRETLRRLGERVRAAFAGDAAQALLEERLEGERELARLAEAACAEAESGQARDVLDGVQAELAEARRRLEAALAERPSQG